MGHEAAGRPAAGTERRLVCTAQVPQPRVRRRSTASDWSFVPLPAVAVRSRPAAGRLCSLTGCTVRTQPRAAPATSRHHSPSIHPPQARCRQAARKPPPAARVGRTNLRRWALGGWIRAMRGREQRWGALPPLHSAGPARPLCDPTAWQRLQHARALGPPAVARAAAAAELSNNGLGVLTGSASGSQRCRSDGTAPVAWFTAATRHEPPSAGWCSARECLPHCWLIPNRGPWRIREVHYWVGCYRRPQTA